MAKQNEKLPGITLYDALTDENKIYVKYYELAMADLYALRELLADNHRTEIDLALQYMHKKEVELMISLYCKQASCENDKDPEIQTAI